MAKGEFEQGCYKKTCSNMVSDWLNHQNGKYYCRSCANLINRFNGEYKALHGHNVCEKIKK